MIATLFLLIIAVANAKTKYVIKVSETDQDGNAITYEKYVLDSCYPDNSGKSIMYKQLSQDHLFLLTFNNTVCENESDIKEEFNQTETRVEELDDKLIAAVVQGASTLSSEPIYRYYTNKQFTEDGVKYTYAISNFYDFGYNSVLYKYKCVDSLCLPFNYIGTCGVDGVECYMKCDIHNLGYCECDASKHFTKSSDGINCRCLGGYEFNGSHCVYDESCGCKCEL